MDLIKELHTRILSFDGGTGSLLVERGLSAGELPESFNTKHPEIITELHTAYIEAGADIIKTNTFGAYSHKLGKEQEKTVRAAIDCARAAVNNTGKNTMIALDVGPLGKLLAPFGDLSFDSAVELFKELIEIGKEGCDLILIETMSDLYELKAAVVAAKEASSLPIVATVALDARGKLLTGADPETVAALLEGLGVAAFGVNCGFGPRALLPHVKKLLAVSSTPIIANPNAGLPEMKDGKAVYSLSPDAFAEEMREMLDAGVSVVGGCCGTTPAHIKALGKLLETRKAPEITDKKRTVVTSYTKSVCFGDGVVLIGERLNPTGKPKLKAALREGNLGYLAEEGIAQVEKGAHILDLNVGLPEISEEEVLLEAMRTLQEVTDTPLQLDTANSEAMARACRYYNGKPLINSVNGKKESMDKIFPIAKKYGGVMIALTLDENGIPASVEGRVAIAERILEEGAKYGFAAKDFVFDPLALAVSSDPESALVTLGTVKALTERGLYTSLGVSNISFGLPERERINGTFFAMAMQSGLSCAIMNPHSDVMMTAYRAFMLLSGKDEGAKRYMASLAPKDTETLEGLRGAIVKGLCDRAEALTEALLMEKSPLAVIEEEIVPALDTVGEGFELGRFFLPQLLASAEAAKVAFAVIKKAMPVSEKSGKSLILATVKGDIHDIGKNIVKVMLENYGYTVIDLGRDVPIARVVEAIGETGVSLVGLSALMTTTVSSMADTIKAIRDEYPNVKIMVGGAVLTEEYAEMIGADFYAKDAMAAVRIAELL